MSVAHVVDITHKENEGVEADHHHHEGRSHVDVI